MRALTFTPEDKGRTFGKLMARAGDPGNPKYGTHWWFYCECGSYKSIRVSNVLNGKTKSCGCLRAQYVEHLTRDLGKVSKLQRALNVAMEFMAQPGLYQRSDNTVKEINEILYGKTGE